MKIIGTMARTILFVVVANLFTNWLDRVIFPELKP